MMDNTTMNEGDEDPIDHDEANKKEALSHMSCLNNSQDNTESNSNTANSESNRSNNALADDIEKLTTELFNLLGYAPMNLALHSGGLKVPKEQTAEGFQDRDIGKPLRQKEGFQGGEVKLPGKFGIGDFSNGVDLEETKNNSENHQQEHEQASPTKRQKLTEDVQETEGQECENFSQILSRILKQWQREETNIALAGVFEKLELHNFLCHTNLNFDFNRHVNFIIGKKGFGKSAIMSAIMVVLGNESEDRNLTEFIQNGADKAQVRLTISNRGINAYRQDKYGESIIICRLINKNESKITIETCKEEINEAGTKLSVKKVEIITKQELQNILQFMKICLPNCFALMTEDIMKSFWQMTDFEKIYFSIKEATQIHEALRIHQKINESIQKLNDYINSLEKNLQDVQEKRAELVEQSKMQKLEEKLTGLKNEHAWALVSIKEQSHDKRHSDISKYYSHLRNMNEALQELGKTIKTMTLNLTAIKYLIKIKDINIARICKKKRELQKSRDISIRKVLQQSKDVLTAEKQLQVVRAKCEALEHQMTVISNRSEQLDSSESNIAEVNQKYLENYTHVVEKELNVRTLREEFDIAKNELPSKKTKWLLLMTKLRIANKKRRQLKREEIEMARKIKSKKDIEQCFFGARKFEEERLHKVVSKLQFFNVSLARHVKEANKRGARIYTNRPPNIIFNEIEKLEAYLRISRNTIDPELVQQQIAEFEKSEVNLKEEIDVMKKGRENISNEINERKKLVNFKMMQIYAEITDFFQFFFETQSFKGQVEFDHYRQSLNISLTRNHPVCEVLNNPTDEERSFSLIALTFAVINKMVSPFYIMDEFDQFLDIGSIKSCRDMIQQMASSRRRYQFIFLTPHDLSDEDIQEHVTLFRLADPSTNCPNAQADKCG